MKRLKKLVVLFAISILMNSCVPEDVRNITGVLEPEPELQVEIDIKPVNINETGFDFLEKIQGHWIGTNRIIADDFDWFSFDFRAISSSHVHSIFEGGSMGNLFTSFFVTDFNNTRTLMARNGGLLNGIYRTSYFVLDKTEENSRGKYYRFVDAKGSTNVMHMEFRFVKDSMYFNAYTSKLGLNVPPTRHLTFKSKLGDDSLAKKAAEDLNFPQNVVEFDFSNGLKEEFLYVNPGDDKPKSATFLAQDNESDVFELAEVAGDPFKLVDHPYLAYLFLDITRTDIIKDKSLLTYLSKEPLTNQDGQFSNANAFNSIIQLPELIPEHNQFLFTYLHPGNYYLTIVADMDANSAPSTGDITSKSKLISIAPLEQKEIEVNDINIQN